MKVYISGRITGTCDYMQRFCQAEKLLRVKGYEVVNPAKENAKLPEGTSWSDYMRASIKMLCECDSLYLMKGWITSKGACLERYIAYRLGMDVIEEGINDL